MKVMKLMKCQSSSTLILAGAGTATILGTESQGTRGFLYLAGVIPVKPSIEYEDCTTQLYLGSISEAMKKGSL